MHNSYTPTITKASEEVVGLGIIWLPRRPAMSGCSSSISLLVVFQNSIFTTVALVSDNENSICSVKGIRRVTFFTCGSKLTLLADVIRRRRRPPIRHTPEFPLVATGLRSESSPIICSSLLFLDLIRSRCEGEFTRTWWGKYNRILQHSHHAAQLGHGAGY